MNDNALLEKILKDNRERSARELSVAKEAALATGKEPLDLVRLDALWPWNPDNRDKANGHSPTDEERLARWEPLYFVEHAEILTVEAFAEAMRSLQRQGVFD